MTKLFKDAGFTVGQVIEGKDLLGLETFSLKHSATFGDDDIRNIEPIKWDNGKETISYTYGSGQTASVYSDDKLVIIDSKIVTHECDAFRFLGRGWREEYKA